MNDETNQPLRLGDVVIGEWSEEKQATIFRHAKPEEMTDGKCIGRLRVLGVAEKEVIDFGN